MKGYALHIYDEEHKNKTKIKEIYKKTSFED